MAGGALLACERAATPPAVPQGLEDLAGANLMLIIVDTLRADWTSPYGCEHDTSPELARWSQHGVLFERVLAQSSWTKISVASLMTSLWPRTHGIREPRDGLSDEALTLAEVLHQHGYATYGVQSNGWLHQSFGFHQGFDRYLFPRGGSRRRFARATVWPHADRVYQELVRLLDAHDPGRPFFIYLHFMDVHQYAAPPEFQRFGTGDRGSYLAAIRWIDDTLRRIREKLEAAGFLQTTVIAFASDHGETFGEHGVYGHARNVLTPVLRVPLVLRLPFDAGGGRVTSQVRNLDIAPTLLEAVGIPVPESFEGRSLLPLFGSSSESARPDRISFAGLGTPLFRNARLQVSVSDGAWTYARNLEENAAPAELLFDRRVDPGENVNLVGLEQAAAGGMRALLDRYLAQEAADVRETDVRIDPTIAARLRALGYLQGGSAKSPE